VLTRNMDRRTDKVISIYIPKKLLFAGRILPGNKMEDTLLNVF